MRKRFLPALIGVILLLTACCQAAITCGYPIEIPAATTLERTVVPDRLPEGSPKLYPNDTRKFKAAGYGKWHYEAGLPCQKRLDLMPAVYSDKGVEKKELLVNFFALGDVLVTDEETPAQAVYFGFQTPDSWAYTPEMLYSAQVLDAAVQTLNDLHRKNKFNFGLMLGDACNNNQHNELVWYLGVMEGKKVKPDSGRKNDPLRGPLNDHQDEFLASGLDGTIPWYQVLGEHDRFWMGYFKPDQYLKKTLTGQPILDLGDIFTDPKAADSRGFYMGAVDGASAYGDIIGCGPEKAFPVPPQVAEADPDRRSLTVQEWIKAFFDTVSQPRGHGFAADAVKTGFAGYSFEPKSKFPIKVIVLDDTNDGLNPNLERFNQAYLDKARFDWLVKQLDDGQTLGKLMIVAAHFPVGVEPEGSPNGWSQSSPVTEKQLLAKLHAYPNLILWMASHRGLNQVTPLPSPKFKQAELGFWEVETASLRDFPQQFRTVQIYRNSDSTISIVVTNVDPAVKEGSPAGIARHYAVAMQQLGAKTLPQGLAPSGAYNAELVKTVTPPKPLLKPEVKMMIPVIRKVKL